MEGEIKEKYRQLYMELFDLLDRAYMDRYMLEVIIPYYKEVKKKRNMYGQTRAYYVLNHVFLVLQEDLCSTIWKMYFDKSGKAHTIQTMAHFLHEATDKNHESKLSKKLSAYGDIICIIRNQGLAHNDKEKSRVSIDLQVLFQILDEICLLFSNMYDKSIGASVLFMNENHLRALRHNCSEGLHLMLYRDKQPVVIQSHPLVE